MYNVLQLQGAYKANLQDRAQDQDSKLHSGSSRTGRVEITVRVPVLLDTASLATQPCYNAVVRTSKNYYCNSLVYLNSFLLRHS